MSASNILILLRLIIAASESSLGCLVSVLWALPWTSFVDNEDDDEMLRFRIV